MELNVEKNGNWWVGLVVFPEEPSAEAKSRQLKLTVINGSVFIYFRKSVSLNGRAVS